jgi:hypothetical protein
MPDIATAMIVPGCIFIVVGIVLVLLGMAAT